MKHFIEISNFPRKKKSLLKNTETLNYSLWMQSSLDPVVEWMAAHQEHWMKLSRRKHQDLTEFS